MLLVLAGGALIVDRINKFPLVLTFTGVYFALCTLVGLAAPTAVAELFRAPFVQATLFLGLFMLTDPPTAPSRYGDQVVIGVVAAASVAAEWLCSPDLPATRIAGRQCGTRGAAMGSSTTSRTARPGRQSRGLPDHRRSSPASGREGPFGTKRSRGVWNFSEFRPPGRRR